MIDTDSLLGMVVGMAKSKIVVTCHRRSSRERAVRKGHAEGVSAYIVAALEVKTKLGAGGHASRRCF